MLVKEIMQRKVVTIDSHSPVKAAAEIMCRRNVGSIVVLEKREAVGIVTEKDVVRLASKALNFSDTPVREIMSSPIIAAEPEVTVEDALRLMISKGIKKLPIVKERSLIGIITLADFVTLMPELISAFERFVKGKLPKTFEKYYRIRPQYIA